MGPDAWSLDKTLIGVWGIITFFIGFYYKSAL